MKNILILLMGLVASTSTLFGIDKKPAYQAIEASAYKTQVEADSNVILVDVRTPGEYASGHIAGAINIDYHAENFAELIGKLPHDKRVHIYGPSGNRSRGAGEIMVKLGFIQVVDLAGGIRMWQAAGYKLVEGTKPR